MCNVQYAVCCGEYLRTRFQSAFELNGFQFERDRSKWNANQKANSEKKNVIGSWKAIALLRYNGVVKWQERGEEKPQEEKKPTQRDIGWYYYGSNNVQCDWELKISFSVIIIRDHQSPYMDTC